MGRFSRRYFAILASALPLLLVGLWWVVPPVLADHFVQRGLASKQQWRLRQSLREFERALKFAGNNESALLERALVHQLRGDFLSSQKDLERILSHPEISKTRQVALLNAAGINHFSFSQPDRALAYHEKGLRLASELGLTKLEGQSCVNLSRVLYHAKGRHEDALRYLERGLKLGKDSGDLELQADALRNLGVIHWWFRAELDRPLALYYFPALDLYRRAGQRHGEATTLSNISLIYGFKGDIFEALNYQRQSIEIREQIGDDAGLADSFLSMGQFFAGIENYRKAGYYFRRSLDLASSLGYQLTQDEVEVYLANNYVLLGEAALAVPLLKQAAERQRHNPVLARYRYGALANAHGLAGDHEAALIKFRQALSINETLQSPDERFIDAVRLVMADSLMALGKWEEAGQLLGASTDSSDPFRDYDAIGVLAEGLTRAWYARHQEREEEALNHLQIAIDRQTSVIVKSSTSFVIGPDRRFLDRMFSFLLDTPKPSPRAVSLAFQFLEHIRYRTLRNFILRLRQKLPAPAGSQERERRMIAQIDRLNAELHAGRDSVRPSLRSLYNDYEDLVLKTQLDQPRHEIIRSLRPIEVSTLQAALSEKTAVIEYIVAGEQIFALVIRPDKLDAILLPEATSQIRERAKLFSTQLFHEQAGNDWRASARKLYDVLIGVLESRESLEDVDRLCIIPFSFLHEVPFAALVNHKGSFLIDNYVLTRAPSATFLDQPHDQGAKTRQSLSLLALSSGPGQQDFAALTSADNEVREIASTGPALPLLNAEASETRFKTMAPDFRLIHLAGHGVFEPDMPLLSRLLLSPSAEDDGFLTVHEVFYLGLNTELVTLSACETGRNATGSGLTYSEIDRVGLVEAFLHAGAKNVVATLLPVRDRPTTEFMKTFYSRLSSEDFALALANTQRVFAYESSQPYMRHPRHWAPFVLVGEAR